MVKVIHFYIFWGHSSFNAIFPPIQIPYLLLLQDILSGERLHVILSLSEVFLVGLFVSNGISNFLGNATPRPSL